MALPELTGRCDHCTGPIWNASPRHRLCKGCRKQSDRRAQKRYKDRKAQDPEHVEKQRAIARERYWADPARARARSRDYVARNRNKVQAANRQRYAENREERRAYHRAYSAANPERNRRWYEANREELIDRARIADANKRAERWGCEGTLSVEDWRAVQAEAEGRCAYCAEEAATPTIDHKIPLSRGGANRRDNIALSCRSCNAKKWTRTPEEFDAHRSAA
jgi:5-methylcytosine-specific restriction endonuclease McrA